jgi:hypothetical protein
MLLGVYFVLAGVTWVAGGSMILDRLSPGDIVMLCIFVYYGVHFITTHPILYWRILFVGFVPLLIVMLLSLSYTGNPRLWNDRMVCTSFCSMEWIRDLSIRGAVVNVKLWIVAGGILGFFIIYNVIAPILSLPTVFNPNNVPGAPIGTFRNTGQAGEFMAAALALGLLLFSVCRTREKWVVGVANLICMVALILTVKRAAIIGFLVGIALLLILNFRWQNLLVYAAAAVVVVTVTVPAMNLLSSEGENYKWHICRFRKAVIGGPFGFERSCCLC